MTLKASLREGVQPGKLQGVADADLMKRVTREANYTGWTKEFLGRIGLEGLLSHGQPPSAPLKDVRRLVLAGTSRRTLVEA